MSGEEGNPTVETVRRLPESREVTFRLDREPRGNSNDLEHRLLGALRERDEAKLAEEKAIRVLREEMEEFQKDRERDHLQMVQLRRKLEAMEIANKRLGNQGTLGGEMYLPLDFSQT